MQETLNFARYRNRLRQIRLAPISGKVTETIGLLVKAQGLKLPIGEACLIQNKRGQVPAEVIGFQSDQQVMLMVLGEMEGLSPGDEVLATGRVPSMPVGQGLLGRVVDSMGRPIDNKGPVSYQDEYPLYQSPPSPLERKSITDTVSTGVRAIDALLTLGKGQRIGVFGGSGVGKTILMGMIARNTTADVNVIALIGERGREVQYFTNQVLGEEGLKQTVVVAATSDQPALMRIRGAFAAAATAEYFRDQGKDVLFMMDSVTRLAMAQREVGMTIGEPPTTRGYTPSVFSMLPKLMERSGTSSGKGSITGVYSVLVEGDDMMEPVADATRSILDGHIILSRELASQGHYPSIDILESVSRLMVDIVPSVHLESADRLRQLLATYRTNQTLVNIGLYRKGTDPQIDMAVNYRESINNFLRQEIEDERSYDQSISTLCGLFG